MSAAKILMVLTSAGAMNDGEKTGLWLEEFTEPWRVFRDAGCDITVASLKGGSIPIDPRSDPTPEQREKWDEAIRLLADTRPLESVWEKDYDVVFVPGGHGTMFDMPENPLLAAVIERTYAGDRIVAAVCHGPAALVGTKKPDGSALVQGHSVTCFSDREERDVGLDRSVPFMLESRLRELGAEIHNGEAFGENVIVDGRLITGQNPPSSELAARKVVEALEEA